MSTLTITRHSHYTYIAMGNPDQHSPAEIADRHRRYMALAMLAVSLMFLFKAAAYLVSDELAMPTDIVVVMMAVLTIALIAPIMIWKIRHRSSAERIVYFSKDGFAAQVLSYSQRISWVITFVFLIFLEGLTEILSNYPTEFVLQIVIAVLVGTKSLVYLYKTRSSGGLEFEEGEASHA